MFMYRFLPLPATLLEGKPITYGFERPYQTFFYETLLFILSSLAFYISCIWSKNLTKNNAVQKVLKQMGFFEVNVAVIWGMGIIGVLARLYFFATGEIEYGNVLGKFISRLNYLMFAPLCLFFPSILNIKFSNTRAVWLYTAFIFVLNFASNSRQSIIAPIATIILICLLFLIINDLRLRDVASTGKTVIVTLTLVVTYLLISNVSLAMLHTRKIRDKVDKSELFSKTLETLQNEALMERLHRDKEQKEQTLISYSQGWTEHYLDNFMLGRYANMRITDETLYYAEKKGYANKEMSDAFWTGVLAVFPTPILRYFGVQLDKNKQEFSSGDLLYGKGLGGYRVTSHVGDGLATFGYWYFPIQTIAFFLVFMLLNTFVWLGVGTVQYAPYALMNVFLFLGMFRNAGGMSAEFGYILRGYFQGVFTYLVIFWILKYFFGNIGELDNVNE